MEVEGKAKSEVTRQRIVEATIELLVDAGFARTTIRAVAAEAATSVGAVQYHFPSKQALLLETLTEIFREGVERLAALRSEGEGGAPRAHRIVRSLWAFYSGRRYQAASEILLGTRMEPAASRPMLRARERLTRSYRAAWDEALADSPLPAEQRPVLLQLVTSSLRGMALLGLHERDAAWFEPVLRALEGLVDQVLASGELPAMDPVRSAPGRASAGSRPRRLAIV